MTMLSNLDAVCGTATIIKEMSFFAATISIVLFILTVPINGIVFFAIMKYRHMLHRSFYLIIANIAAADLCAGVVTNILSLSFHIKEGMEQNISAGEIKALHYTFFALNGVSVLSMTVLSLDRLGVLLNPFYYYNKMTKRRTILLLLFTWGLSSGLAGAYFKLGYIRYLAIFGFTTIVLTMVVMVTTMALFKRRLTQSEKAAVENNTGSADLNTANKSRQRTLHNFTQMDKRVTTTFLWMLVLFLVNYLPVLLVVLYMNLCEHCSCEFIHVSRDLVFLSILSSGLFRAVNFIVRLTALREAVKSLLKIRQKQETVGYDINCV